MSPFAQDVIKILLDKLLLGLIAAGFGFYLSRLLEDYRTHNAYQLILSKEKVDAYRKFLELITKHHYRVMGLFGVIRSAKEKYPEGLSEEEAKPGYAYIQNYDDFRNQAFPLLALMSENVKVAFSTFLSEGLKVSDYVKVADFSRELPDEAQIDEAYLIVIEACRVAMSTKD
jgi:hypothetical protein